jgi:O-antigen/teichoic acid export membrane protein
VQHDALLRRQMRFSALAFRDVASYVVGVPVGIIFALRGAGYWALVALPLTMNVTAMTLTWVLVKWIPGLPRRAANIRSLVAFGGNVAASYLICNAMRSSDTVLIGRKWGAGPLGLYSRAYNLLLLPVRQLSAPARSVAVPTFSRTQDDPERFSRYYLRTINLMMWIGVPVFAFLFVAAEPVIVLALGKQWREAAPVFRILSISALGQLMFESTIWLFVSRGESRHLLKLFLALAPITVASFAAGLPFRIKGVAFSGSVVLIAIFPWVLKQAFRGTTLTLRRLAEAIAVPVFLCLPAIVVAEIALHLVGTRSVIPELLITSVCFVVAYAISLALPVVRNEFQLLLEMGRSVYSKWAGPSNPSLSVES